MLGRVLFIFSTLATSKHVFSGNVKDLYRINNQGCRARFAIFKLPVSSQLDSLKERVQLPISAAHELDLMEENSTASLEKAEIFLSEIGAGMRGFGNEDCEFVQSHPRKEDHSDSCDESISDEENAAFSKFPFTSGAVKYQESHLYNSESENQGGVGTWSAVHEEANDLVGLHKRPDNYSLISDSGARRIQKGGRGRTKLKFSIRSQSYKEEVSWPCAVKGENERSYEGATEGFAGQKKFDQIGEKSMADQLEGLQEELADPHLTIKLVAHEHRGAVPSVADLLEDLQKDDPKAASNLLLQNVRVMERKAQFGEKRNISPLGTRILDNEDPPEFMGSGMSSEDEDFGQNHLRFATQKIERQTMADLFQEAFSAAVVDAPLFRTSKESGIGYHGRLQQVMLIEKERHLEFLKELKTSQSPYNESSFIAVRILSRFLEAKLTVCHCLLGENNMNSLTKGPLECDDYGGTVKRTIIFSSKICNNVELEVGNLVHIHPPWKEVQVNEDEKIILCTYFSQILA